MTSTARRTHHHRDARRIVMHTTDVTDTPVTPDSRGRPRGTPRGENRREGTREMTTLSLTELIDLRTDAQADGEAIPCREYDAELWFAESPADVEFAKSLCGTCPALQECLAGALERREPWGVWGGQLFVQGVVVPRKRPRGRPRKNEIAA